MGVYPCSDTYLYEEELYAAMMDAGMVDGFMFAYVLVLFVSMICMAACYVFQSIGLYAIAQRRKIRHGWLAWVPFGNMWILGSISDQYQYLVKGNIKGRRKILLGLNIGCVASYMFAMLCGVLGFLNQDAVLFMLGYLLGALGYAVTIIILIVFMYIACYDLYRSCKPDDGVLFLVLSILIPVTLPIFVFACRNQDQGMPPRKQPVQTVPVTEQPEEAEDEETTEAEEGFAQPEEFEE